MLLGFVKVLYAFRFCKGFVCSQVSPDPQDCRPQLQAVGLSCAAPSELRLTSPAVIVDKYQAGSPQRQHCKTHTGVAGSAIRWTLVNVLLSLASQWIACSAYVRSPTSEGHQ